MSPADSRDPLDSLGLWPAASELPEQLPGLLSTAARSLEAAGWGSGERAGRGDPPGGGRPVHSVVALGLGADGVAASAAAALTRTDLALPFWVGQAPGLPRFVDEHAVVFALSEDGGNEDVLAAASEAAGRGARVVAVGGGPGSPLATLAAGAGFTWCPRAGSGERTLQATCSLVVTVLAALARCALVPDPVGSVDAAAATLARRRDRFVGVQGEAAVVARRLGRTIPLVYGSDGVGGAAAQWWKVRVNLNAKAPAFCGTVPAVAYDELSGWGQGGDVTRQVVTAVLLHHSGEAARADALFAGVRLAIDEVMADVVEVHAAGGDDLARLFDLMLLGELVSLHLAAREGVDPGPVPAVPVRPAGQTGPGQTGPGQTGPADDPVSAA